MGCPVACLLSEKHEIFVEITISGVFGIFLYEFAVLTPQF